MRHTLISKSFKQNQIDWSFLRRSLDRLIDAAENGKVEHLNSCLRVVDQYSKKYTAHSLQAALQKAAVRGHVEVVNSLLDKRVFPLISHALVLAADQGHVEVVNTLLANGANPGDNPHALESAAFQGHIEVVKTLLANGADPTPHALENAVHMGHLDVVNTLLANGSDLSQIPHIFKFAARLGHGKVVNTLNEHIPNHFQPRHLSVCTRNCIRARLINRLDKGQSLKSAIESLPLPTTLKQYVFNPLTL